MDIINVLIVIPVSRYNQCKQFIYPRKEKIKFLRKYATKKKY